MRVLHTVRPSDDLTNPFVNLLLDALSARVTQRTFAWPAAFRARYDVVHMQWPEKLVSPSPRTRGIAVPVKSALKIAAFRLLLWRLRAMRVGVVLTVHNLTAHEGLSRGAARALGALDRLVHERVILNPLPDGDHRSDNATLIPHGHYCELVGPAAPAPQTPRLIYFGLIREYKQVPELVRAYAESALPSRDIPLRIVGEPWTSELANAVRDAARSAPSTVSCDLRSLPSAQLYDEIRRSSAVVLPYARMYNSGAAVLSLSLARPVIVPDTSTTRRLRDSYGPSWVQLYRSPLTAEKLTAACERIFAAQEQRPALDLSDLDWSALAGSYAAVYRRAAIRARAPRRG